jgi:multiple sugar transport system substrate-binding protein
MNRREFLKVGLGAAAVGTVGVLGSQGVSGAASSLAGARRKAPTGSITVWMHQEAAFQDVYEKLVTRFEHSHPGTKITTLYIPFADLETKTMTAYLGGDPPDIVKLPGTTFPQFSSKGLFAPVDAAAMGFASIGAFKAAFEPNTTSQLTYNGRIYGVPITWNALFLFYNKNDFRAAGLNPARPPTTWEELVQVGKKLTKYKSTGAVERAGFQWTYEEATEWTYMDLLGLVVGLGGTILKDGKGNLSSKEGIQALTYYQDMSVKYKISSPNITSTGYDPGIFANNQASMLISSNWMTPLVEGINKSFKLGPDWGVAPTPKWQGKAQVTISYTYGWAVAKSSKDAALAWEFIRYLESQSSVKAMLDGAGIIEPIRNWHSLAPNTPGYDLEAKLASSSTSGPNVPYYHKMAAALTTGLQALARGKTTPAAMAAQFDATPFT